MVYTIGHGRRSLDQLIGLLEEHGIRQLFDIRRIPRSATNPQFNSDGLMEGLAARGIGYEHLGGPWRLSEASGRFSQHSGGACH
jgi:uncharacterized protein (DUF488 family)